METMKTTAKIITYVCMTVLLSLSVAVWAKDTSGTQAPDAYEDSTDLSDRKQGYLNNKTGLKKTSGDPVELGRSSVFEYNLLNTDVEQKDVTYFYYPDSSEIALRLDSETLHCYYLFNEFSRAACRRAIEQYQRDFSAHLLNRKSGKSYMSYGDSLGHFKWGLIGSGNETLPKLSLGYKFVKNSPYFTLTFWPAQGVCQVEAQRDTIADSDKMTILMTKKQALDFAGYMDEQKISDLRNSLSSPVQEGDVY
jgi:hypothetical protein